jgi:hypothetical protein
MSSMKHPFKYYLHDDADRWERADYIMEQIPSLNMTKDEFMEKIGRPFYEIELQCVFDDVTGEVTIVSAE